MIFRVYPIRVHFRAVERIAFGHAGNTIRGAFGDILRHVYPSEYEAIFRPKRGEGPSGLADPPRPFVFRVANLDGAVVDPGDGFHLDAHLFLRSKANLFANALKELVLIGLGPSRGTAELVRFEDCAAVEVPLNCEAKPISHIRISFLTPTELKPAGRVDFATVFGRARDRVATLCDLYGEGAVSIAFKEMGERAHGVRLATHVLRSKANSRTSSRTGQTHPLGGFVGHVEYEGELAEFVPFLRAAEWTGIGRHTVWGNGAIRLEVRE